MRPESFFRLRLRSCSKISKSGPYPGPAFLQIRESDSCSDSGNNHRSNRNLTMFLPKKDRTEPATAEMEKWHRVQVVFFTIFDSGSGSRSEKKTQNPAGVDSGKPDPVSSEFSDICEISDLILFFNCFSSQNKEIRSGNHFFDVCCVNYNILVGYQVPTTSYSTGITFTIENFRT